MVSGRDYDVETGKAASATIRSAGIDVGLLRTNCWMIPEKVLRAIN